MKKIKVAIATYTIATMMKVTILTILTIILLDNQVHGLPSGGNNSTHGTIVTKTVEESGNCGHVTNVIVHGAGGTGEVGPQGERGEIGPRGPQGERGLRGEKGERGQDAPTQSVGGVVFTRWGKTTCPSGTELLYQGITAGSHRHQAGSAEHLCLHQQPQFLQTSSGYQYGRARLYATEYNQISSPSALGNRDGHDAPCAVCYASTRNAKVMIPSRTSCPPSWTREYYGYLMTDKHYSDHKSRVPICMDVNAGSVPGSAHHNVHSIISFMETSCSGIKCPPYFEGAEVTCVVCTK